MHRAWVVGWRLAVLALLGGCAHGSTRQAEAGPPPGRACFRPQDVSAWSAGRRDVLTLRVKAHDYFRMTLTPACSGLDLGRKVGLQARAGDWICQGDPATLVSVDAAGLQQRCSVAAVRPLSTEEVAALSRDERP